MSWSIEAPAPGGARLAGRELERLHPLHLARPERHLLAVLPLHGDPGVLADAPDRVVGLVVLEDGAGADEGGLLDDRHELVGVRGAGLLDDLLRGLPIYLPHLASFIPGAHPALRRKSHQRR